MLCLNYKAPCPGAEKKKIFPFRSRGQGNVRSQNEFQTNREKKHPVIFLNKRRQEKAVRGGKGWLLKSFSAVYLF